MKSSDSKARNKSGQAGSSGQATPKQRPRRPSAGYIQWLESRSMLYQAGCRGNISGVKTGNPGAALRGAGHVLPDKVHFGGEYVVEIQEHPVHIKDSRGAQRSALPMFEVAQGVEIEFEAKILRQPAHLTEDMYERLWHLAQEEGLGSRRELGHGKFELVRCESVK